MKKPLYTVTEIFHGTQGPVESFRMTTRRLNTAIAWLKQMSEGDNKNTANLTTTLTRWTDEDQRDHDVYIYMQREEKIAFYMERGILSRSEAIECAEREESN